MTELLVPEPKPKGERIPWVKLVALVLLLMGAGFFGSAIGYELGFGDSEQAERDAEYYRGIAETCAASLDTVSRQAIHALVEVRRVQLYMASAAEYADSMRANPLITLMARAD